MRAEAQCQLTVMPFATSRFLELWTHTAVPAGKEAGFSLLTAKVSMSNLLKRDCIFPLALHSGLGSAGWFFHPCQVSSGWKAPKSIFTQTSGASAEVAGTRDDCTLVPPCHHSSFIHRVTQDFKRQHPKRTDPSIQICTKASSPAHLPRQFPSAKAS